MPSEARLSGVLPLPIPVAPLLALLWEPRPPWPVATLLLLSAELGERPTMHRVGVLLPTASARLPWRDEEAPDA